jgi:hypothetical protein
MKKLASILAFLCGFNPYTLEAATVYPLYCAHSFWNQPIPKTAATDSNSAAMIAYAITPYVSGANFDNGPEWGIGLVQSSLSYPVSMVGCTAYNCDTTVFFPIPSTAKPSSGSDAHLTVMVGDQELDMWQAAYNSSAKTWSAGSRFQVANDGWGANTLPCGGQAPGSVMAGFAGMGGVVRPEEILQGWIGHALSLQVITAATYFVSPATATGGWDTNPAAMPAGARIQLDPTFDVYAQNWPQWEMVIAVALQTYGAYVSDVGGSIAFYGQTDVNVGNTTWSASGTPYYGALANLPWSRMRVVERSTPLNYINCN